MQYGKNSGRVDIKSCQDLCSDVGDSQIVFSCPEAGTAVDRSIPFWLEGHSGFTSTVCAGDFCCCCHVFTAALNTHQDAAVGAAFRLIRQTFSFEEVLLTTCENKGGVAVTAIEDFIDVGHNVIPGETKSVIIVDQ